MTLLVSGKHAEEQTKIAADFGIKAIEIPSVRLPGMGLGMLSFPFKMFSCVRKAGKVLKQLDADVLLGMGDCVLPGMCHWEFSECRGMAHSAWRVAADAAKPLPERTCRP